MTTHEIINADLASLTDARLADLKPLAMRRRVEMEGWAARGETSPEASYAVQQLKDKIGDIRAELDRRGF